MNIHKILLMSAVLAVTVSGMIATDPSDTKAPNPDPRQGCRFSDLTNLDLANLLRELCNQDNHVNNKNNCNDLCDIACCLSSAVPAGGYCDRLIKNHKKTIFEDGKEELIPQKVKECFEDFLFDLIKEKIELSLSEKKKLMNIGRLKVDKLIDKLNQRR